jgi:LmbE family N-acetylglucosaminyl deacetylase
MSSKGARRLARRHFFPLVESFWTTGFAVAGRLLRPTRHVRQWSSPGGQRVVVIAPHPDDETIGVGGTIGLHLQAGDSVQVAVVTDGSASRAGASDRAETARRREEELRSATEMLGVQEVICLRLAEWQWQPSEAASQLAPLLASAQIIYAPSCVDYHPEHVRVARLVSSLLRAEQIVRVYEVGVPLTTLVNLVADISSTAERKDRALAAYRTQIAALEPPARWSRYGSRLYGLSRAELFWELPADAFARVMEMGNWHSGSTPFRGLTERPLADPAAVLVGLRKRRVLREVARHELRLADVLAQESQDSCR